MKKFTNESDAGAARAKSMMIAETVSEPPTTSGAQKVDPSVTLGPLQGEPKGSVVINSPAYTGKF